MLLKVLSSSPDSLEAGRETGFDKLRQELLSHAKAEHETVYRRLAEKTDKQDIVDEIGRASCRERVSSPV